MAKEVIVAGTNLPRLTGNQFWKLRSKHGTDRLFSDPEVLRAEALLYFDWCDRHPLERAELIKHKGDGELYDVPLGRPYSLAEFSTYLYVSQSYLNTALTELREKVDGNNATANELELIRVIEWIRGVVFSQQFNGASVGIFNANLISRVNGIADNVNNNNVGADPVLRLVVRDAKTAEDLGKLGD